MTTTHHTPIVAGAAASAATFNAVYSELDTAIVATNAEIADARNAYPSLDARLDAFVFAGGNVATQAKNASVAGQKVLTVDSTTGFVPSAYVAYYVGGETPTLEVNTIDTIQAGVSLTLTTNIGTGGVADDAYVSMISLSEYLAANAIAHGGTKPSLTLPEAVEYGSGNVHNVRAFGASTANNAATNTTAFQAAIDAAEAVTGGEVFIPIGDWAFAGGLTVTKPIIIRGQGDYTRLVLTHATADGITLNDGSDFSQLRDFTMNAGAARTGGAGVVIGGDVQVGNCTIERVLFYDLYRAIEFRHAVTTTVSNCRILNVTADGVSQISIANLDNEDGGDNTITGCTFDVAGGTLTHHISWTTGSGVHLVRNKFLGTVTNGVYLNWNSVEEPLTGGGLLVCVGNSFEGGPTTSCLNLGTTAGAFGSIVITGNEFAPLASTQGIRLSGSLSNITITGNTFLATYAEDVIGVNIVAATGCIVNGNSFINVSTGISVTDSASVVDCVVGNNVFHAARTAKITDSGARLVFPSVPEPFYTFQGNDLTPSVAGRSHWYTANDTSTRTITMFDDGVVGQRIVVLIKDEFTKLDFTGTNLRGNVGADWTPASGDWLEAIFDGTYWHCSVHDTTAAG